MQRSCIDGSFANASVENAQPDDVSDTAFQPTASGVNLQIPADARDGDLTLVVDQGDFHAGSVIIPVRR